MYLSNYIVARNSDNTLSANDLSVIQKRRPLWRDQRYIASRHYLANLFLLTWLKNPFTDRRIPFAMRKRTTWAVKISTNKHSKYTYIVRNQGLIF